MKIAILLIGEAMNQYTQVRTDIVGPVTFDYKEQFKVTWVMTPIPDQRARLAPCEAQNLGNSA